MLVKMSGTDSSREGDASPGPWAVIWEILTDKNCLLYQSEVLWKDSSVVEGPRRAVKIFYPPLVHLVAEPLERNAIDSAWGTWLTEKAETGLRSGVSATRVTLHSMEVPCLAGSCRNAAPVGRIVLR